MVLRIYLSVDWFIYSLCNCFCCQAQCYGLREQGLSDRLKRYNALPQKQFQMSKYSTFYFVSCTNCSWLASGCTDRWTLILIDGCLLVNLYSRVTLIPVLHELFQLEQGVPDVCMFQAWYTSRSLVGVARGVPTHVPYCERYNESTNYKMLMLFYVLVLVQGWPRTDGI